MSTTTGEHDVAEEQRVSGAALRAVMRQVPTPVTVVTARAPESEGGAPFGITIGSFASVSLQPPLVSFNVSEEARTYGWLASVERFAVHVLGRDQAELAARFADPGLPPEQQFEELDWQTGPGGAPVIDGVLAVLHCGLHARFRAGDSDIVVGRVIGVDDTALAQAPRGVPDADPLVYHQRGYRTVKFGAATHERSRAGQATVKRSGRRAPETPAPKSAKS